jgi:mersacidin/lichenicidin family type 2 lantibiotic
MNAIVRAWKDEAYLQSLSADQRAMLPANPAGEMELTDAELVTAFGSQGPEEFRHLSSLPVALGVPIIGTPPP